VDRRQVHSLWREDEGRNTGPYTPQNLHGTATLHDRQYPVSHHAGGVAGSAGDFRAAPDGIRYCIEKDVPYMHPRSPDTAEVVSETFAPPPGFTDRHQRSRNC
jgi:hypothetical protein